MYRGLHSNQPLQTLRDQQSPVLNFVGPENRFDKSNPQFINYSELCENIGNVRCFLERNDNDLINCKFKLESM